MVDGQPLATNNSQRSGPEYLNPNQTLSTTNGRAEVLLTPGVFLRIGDNSAVRMVSPDLVNTQVALERGEAMLEVDQLVKDNHISVLDGRATITVQETGLYRLMAGPQPSAAVYDGRLLVRQDDHQIELKKGHQTELAGVLKAQRFDRKQEDALYAWSNVRSQYDSQASYQLAKNVYVSNYYGGPWGMWSPGWYWGGGLGWAWLPYDGAFYSPFGWGFFGPGYVPYIGGYGWRGHSYAFRGTPNTHIAAAGRVGGFHSSAVHSGAAIGGFHGGFAGGGFHGGGRR